MWSPRSTLDIRKVSDADATLTTQMKSVGETMAIGRTFKESLQKALRSLETGRFGLGCDRLHDKWGTPQQPTDEEISAKLVTPNADRIWYIRYALKAGWSVEDVHQRTKIDPWFLYNIREIVAMEDRLRACPSLDAASAELLLEAKQHGFSDKQLAFLWHTYEKDVRAARKAKGIEPVYKLVDTCAAEFEAYTPYYYSTYEIAVCQLGWGLRMRIESKLRNPQSQLNRGRDASPSDKDRIMILGGGPNRIGQGSSSTIVAARPRLHCATPATKRSWSTRIRRRFRRITTPAITCSSNH